MTPEEFLRITDLFEKARLLDPAGRISFVRSATEGSPGLRAAVEQMLRDHEDADGALNDSSLGLRIETEGGGSSSPEPIPAYVGPYRILEILGEGGMGVVYLAEERGEITRRVALKVIKLGMNTKEVLARLEAERQALALMAHPNIANIYGASVTVDGRPYFVMEFVDGEPISQYCDRHGLRVRERLKIFLQVCQGLEHVHKNGVIHRDIKPSNILVMNRDGNPVPKIIDFGVAKATNQRLTEKTIYTQVGRFIGTPTYMSPEQAGLASGEIDHRTDVYSLGVLLYELLSGDTPLDEDFLGKCAYDELHRVIREDEPPTPSARWGRQSVERTTMIAARRGTTRAALKGELGGDLDWIVMRALEKDRERRYSTASALAADIERHLHGEPVLAGPPSATYRMGKFARKNRGFLIAMSIVLVAVTGGLVASLVLYDRAEEKAAELRENLYVTRIRLAQRLAQEGQTDGLLKLLDSVSPLLGERDLRDWEWYYLKSLCHRDLLTVRSHTDGVTTVAWSSDGKRLASAGRDKTVRVWNANNGLEHVSLENRQRVDSVSWKPSGEYLASATADRLRIWDVATWKPILETQELSGHIAWSPDGRRIASAQEKTVIVAGVVPMDDRRHGLRLAEEWRVARSGGSKRAMSWSPNGESLAWGQGQVGEDKCLISDAATGEILRTLDGMDRTLNLVKSLSWNPAGDQVAAAVRQPGNYYVAIWSVESGELLRYFHAHRGGDGSLSWSPDGSWIGTAGTSGSVKIWNTTTWKEQLTLRGHRRAVTSLCWSPDSRRLASASDDQTVKLWDLVSRSAQASADGFIRAAWNHSGRKIAVRGGQDRKAPQTVRLVDGHTGNEIRSFPCGFPGWLNSLAWNPNEREVLAASLTYIPGLDHGYIFMWDTVNGAEKHKIKVANTRSLSWKPDGRWLALGCTDHRVRILGVGHDGEPRVLGAHDDIVGSVAWSPTGKYLASASHDNVVKVWDTRTWEKAHDLRRENVSVPPGFGDGQYSIAWSPDGARLAAGGSAGQVVIWDAITGRVLLSFRGHSRSVWTLGWSASGRRIATGSEGRFLKIWDSTTAQELLSFEGQSGVGSLDWSPDGHRLAASLGEKGRVTIWSAERGYGHAGSLREEE